MSLTATDMKFSRLLPTFSEADRDKLVAAWAIMPIWMAGAAERASCAWLRGFQNLSPGDRRDALEVAERSGSHKAHLLEKDVWVVAALALLFDAPFAGHLTFMGGTSLSKVWRATAHPPKSPS